MAEALFGKENRRGLAWARRMCRVLKKPGGPFSRAALGGGVAESAEAVEVAGGGIPQGVPVHPPSHETDAVS